MDARQPHVRIAELEIDPAELESFNAAIKERVETAVRVEPGVLALYAASDQDRPAHIRVFEIYDDADAYKTHLETPHFKKFRTTTEKMVKSRTLIDAVPIVLGAKGK
jgi:quinol monooxygenase YgiN